MLQCGAKNVNPLERFVSSLPVAAVLPELLAALDGASQVLLSAPTGAGKSTVLADITARVTTGKPWPGEDDWRAPERVLWGSDWPHATASAGLHPVPDDSLQIDTLARWCDQAGADALHRVLVANPAALYGFAPVSISSSPTPV